VLGAGFAHAQAPADDPCLQRASSCASCLGGSCGWCASANECQTGDSFGPSFGLTPPSNCATWAWYYSYCPGTPQDACSQLTTCNDCVTQGQLQPCCRAPCGWCTPPGGGAASCQSGSFSGPWGSVRCQTSNVPDWVWAQFDSPSQCPAAPPSASRSASSTSLARPSGATSNSTLIPASQSAQPGGGGNGNSSNADVNLVAVLGGLCAVLAIALLGAIFLYVREKRRKRLGVTVVESWSPLSARSAQPKETQGIALGRQPVQDQNDPGVHYA